MLPAPPSSCAGWWFTQLWQALLRTRIDRHGTWSLSYPEPDAIRIQITGADPPLEMISGLLRMGTERRCDVTWRWPGEDGMLHMLRAGWQASETAARPLEWAHQRRPFPAPDLQAGRSPWPLHVSIAVHGWHGQLLEMAEIEAADEERTYPVQWLPPPGEPRLPATDLPCVLTLPDRLHPESAPTLTLAGLTLPWRIDLDRDSWAIWRRISAGALLDLLGGPDRFCQRHGRFCPWPATGNVR